MANSIEPVVINRGPFISKMPPSNVMLQHPPVQTVPQHGFVHPIVNQRIIALRNFIIHPILTVHLPVYTENAKFNVFPDRLTANAFWYLPEYQLVFPDQPFFTIISQNSFDSKNNELFKVDVSLSFNEIITPDRQQYFDSLKNLSGFSMTKIPLVPSSVDLVITYQSGQLQTNIPGKINPGGNITFEFEDNENFSAAQLAYRNFADPSGSGEFAQVIFYGMFDAYTQTPGVATAAQNFVRQNIPYKSDTIKLTVPCNTLNGTLYTLQKNNQTTVVGCLAPWSAAAVSGSLFREINSSFDGARIFQSYIQPEFFYVIPSQYYIDRDDSNDYRPSVDVIAMLNPDEDAQSQSENIIVLNFYIKPALTSYMIASLEQLLLNFCPSTANGKIFPVIKFPGNLPYKLSSSNLFDAEADEGTLYDSTDKGYNLRFILSNPLDLAKAGSLIPATLKSPSGYIRKLTFSLDATLQVDSTVTLSFNSTTGDVLDYSFDKTNNNVIITNKSPLKIQVGRLLFYNLNAPGFQDTSLTQPLILAATQQATVPISQVSIPDATTLASFSTLEVDYQIQEDPDDNLTESRICASYLQQTIVVSTNIDPVLHNLQKIQVNASIKIVNINQLLVTLNPQNGAFADHPQFNLTLPLNDDLAKPENQLMDYTVQFYFTDNTTKTTADLQINFGTNPLVFISADQIPT